MTPTELAAWAARTDFTPGQIDCTTTVMLKIIDGKCKMSVEEKAAVAVLYDLVHQRPGHQLGADTHALIARARAEGGEALLAEVYERRVLAETMISRPVMKAYKAWLREAGVIGSRETYAEE
jgi:hypothetical protein